MNAYELAEHAEGLAYEIPADWSSGEPKNVATDIADMLRQQADRIAELENLVSQRFDDGKRLGVLETEDRFRTTPQIKELSDRELVVFLMDEIDRASEWLVNGETHMAIGVLGQCHAKIKKNLSNTKESE